MASYKSPTDDKTISSFPQTFSLKGNQTATFDKQVLSESPLEIKIFGSYDTTKAPNGGGGDALHSFQSRIGDKFGGRMNDGVILAMLEIYEKGINPFVKSVSVNFTPNGTTGPIVEWEVILTESPDGKAYLGFQSRGGAGGTAFERALKQANEKKGDLPNELSEPEMEFLDVFDYKNERAVIRQIFWQYTRPKKYPALNPTGNSSGELDKKDPVKDKNGETKAEVMPENPREIKSSVLLKVKSHTPLVGSTPVTPPPAPTGLTPSGGTPSGGEIIGITEADFYDGIAEFPQLQFSDPGVYIISVIPSSQFLKQTEFTIVVKPEEEFIEQESTEETEPVTGDRPIIAQIDDPGIKLDPIEYTTTEPNDAADIADRSGIVPLIWYNGHQISNSDVKYFELYNDGIVPKAKLTFNDTLGVVKSPNGRSLSDTKFEVFLNSGSDLLKSIHLRFKIEKQKDNKNGTIDISGKLDIDGFYKVDSNSYDGTSFEVLRKISNEFKLGFNSNITNTNDKMKWRRNFIEQDSFIDNIIDHAYISDDSFTQGYIDYYWCFNYVDVEKEWKRDISNDVGLNSQGLQTLTSTDAEKIKKLELLNDKSANDTVFYFSSFSLKNSSTSKLLDEGTYTVSKVYDRVKKQFLKFDIDSISSKGDDKVILKGAPGDASQMNNFRTAYSGKMDTDNVHQNYHYAVSQNNRNMINLTNVKAELFLPQPNYNLYRYLKLKINFINEKETVSNENTYDQRLSGEWIIMDIRFIFSNGKLQQKVVAVRKEFGKTQEEKDNQVTKTEEKDNSEINENPTPPTNRPNEEYIVGETYVVEDKDGNRYELIVDELLFNGVDIKGTIKRI